MINSLRFMKCLLVRVYGLLNWKQSVEYNCWVKNVFCALLLLLSAI